MIFPMKVSDFEFVIFKKVNFKSTQTHKSWNSLDYHCDLDDFSNILFVK